MHQQDRRTEWSAARRDLGRQAGGCTVSGGDAGCGNLLPGQFAVALRQLSRGLGKAGTFHLLTEVFALHLHDDTHLLKARAHTFSDAIPQSADAHDTA